MSKETLGSICHILNGYAFKSSRYTKNGVRIIRITNVQKGYVKDENPQFYPIEECQHLEKFYLYENDLLVSLTGNVGRAAILTKDFLPAALNQRVACVRIKNANHVNKGYLFQYLNSDLFESACIESAQGIAQKNMSTEWLKDFEIPLPPLIEQQKIAAQLDKISGLIAKRKSQIEKLDLLVKAKFMETVSSNAPDYATWKINTIASLASKAKGSMRTGPFGSALLHSEFLDKGVFVLGIDNAVENSFRYNKLRFISEEKYQQLKQYTVFPEDIIITIMGTVGRSAVVPKDIPLAINTKHLACITLNKDLANPLYISYCIHEHPFVLQQIKNSTKGAIMDGMNLTLIKALKIPLPPLPLQTQFADFVQKVEQTKSTMQKSLVRLETLYKARMQEYFE